MMTSTGKTGNRLVGAALALFTAALFCNAAPALPLEGRLLKLDASGPGAIKRMVENFLTERGVILVDDACAPVLVIKGKETREGTSLNARVGCGITRLELRLPRVGLAYAATYGPVFAVGTRVDAARDALDGLKRILEQDGTLTARLGQVAARGYYDFGVPPGSGGRLERIEAEIRGLVIALERNREVRERLRKIESGQAGLMEAVRRLARSAAGGHGRISREALAGILENQRRLLRARKLPYLGSSQCPPLRRTAYDAVGAVLLRVPAAGDGGLRTGCYAIYSENQRLVYERGARYKGPVVFRSMDGLRASGLGRFFRSRRNYLDIPVVGYYPGEHAVVIPAQGADMMKCANRRGMNPDKIFEEGRVVLIPEGE